MAMDHSTHDRLSLLCIAGFIEGLLSGLLDERREAALKRRLNHLSIVLPLLNDANELTYHERLRAMTVLALDSQRGRATPA